ncbi:hypothetical protein SLA2020_086590 [Shorea laevis]
MSGVVYVLTALFFVTRLVLSHAGVDPPTGTASHYYAPTRFAQTACNGSSKLPPSVYPVAAGERLWDGGAGCGRRYRVWCISEGAPRFCKTGEKIVVIVSRTEPRP